ncbi:MAG TPA: DUF4834 family protein [Flavitalea sp.]|nr:DUF4834 family protein [Flavitalea sp.]
MISYIIWTLVFYFLFRFIFNFIVPIFQATRQMRSQVKDFQDKMQGQRPGYESYPPQGGYQSGSTYTTGNESAKSASSASHSDAASPRPKAGDYIDFEEVK